MKSILIIFSIIYLTVASKSDCRFNSSTSEYDLNFIGRSIWKYENVLGDSSIKELWNIQICDHKEESFINTLNFNANTQQDLVNFVEETLLEEVEGKQIQVHIDDEGIYTTDSYFGPQKGIRFVFTSDQVCNYALKSLIVDFVCTDDVQILYKVDNSEECVTRIQVNSSQACPIRTFAHSDDQSSSDQPSSQSSSNQNSDDSSSDQDSDSSSGASSSSFYNSDDGSFILLNFGICFLVTIFSFICTGMCVAWRRRIQRRRENAMRQMSFCLTPTVEVPLFNPYLQSSVYPQYYVYPENPYAHQENQVTLDITADELVARDLQARFDQEDRM